MLQILQGTDVPTMTFSVYDAAGAVIPVADMNDYGVYIYNFQSDVKTKLYEFKMTPGAGENAFVSVDANTLGFIVNRTMTAAISPGVIYAEIEIQTTAAADFTSSLQNSGIYGWAIAEIVESSNPAEI